MTADELARLRVEAMKGLDELERHRCFECGGADDGQVDQIHDYILALEARVAEQGGWRPVTATEPAEELLCEVLVIHEARRIPGRWMRNWSGKPPLFYRPLPEPPEEVKP